tara:strand:- start:1397 stop:1597 length:201 start_codon:yes stop_codon:yes gene_type:complete
MHHEKHNALLTVSAFALVGGGLFVLKAYTGNPVESTSLFPKLILASFVTVASLICYEGARHEFKRH